MGSESMTGCCGLNYMEVNLEYLYGHGLLGRRLYTVRAHCCAKHTQSRRVRRTTTACCMRPASVRCFVPCTPCPQPACQPASECATTRREPTTAMAANWWRCEEASLCCGEPLRSALDAAQETKASCATELHWGNYTNSPTCNCKPEYSGYCRVP